MQIMQEHLSAHVLYGTCTRRVLAYPWAKKGRLYSANRRPEIMIYCLDLGQLVTHLLEDGVVLVGIRFVTLAKDA